MHYFWPKTAGISRSTPWASFSVYFLEKHRTAAALGRPSKSICATSYACASPEPQIIALHLRSGLCPQIIANIGYVWGFSGVGALDKYKL